MTCRCLLAIVYKNNTCEMIEGCSSITSTIYNIIHNKRTYTRVIDIKNAINKIDPINVKKIICKSPMFVNDFRRFILCEEMQINKPHMTLIPKCICVHLCECSNYLLYHFNSSHFDNTKNIGISLYDINLICKNFIYRRLINNLNKINRGLDTIIDYNYIEDKLYISTPFRRNIFKNIYYENIIMYGNKDIISINNCKTIEVKIDYDFFKLYDTIIRDINCDTCLIFNKYLLFDIVRKSIKIVIPHEMKIIRNKFIDIKIETKI